MRSLSFGLVLFGCAALAGRSAIADPAAADEGLRGAETRLPEHAARARLARLPLEFEVNRGQAPARWDFPVRCRGYHAFVASTGIVFSFDGAGLAMTVEDAARCAPSTRGFELPGKVNYFLGNDPSKWLSDVPIVRGARYEEAAPGVTWSVGGRGRALEFAFDVAAGFDASRLRFEGARGLSVAADGSLRLSMPHGEAAISAPVAWQDAPGGRLDVAARFVVEKDGAVRIALVPKDPRRAVHVDPTVTYESYFGTSADEATGGAAMDSSGNAYFAGKTKSTGFPTTNGAYDVSKAEDTSGTIHYDGFVTKLNATGSSLVYSTYLGGVLQEEFNGLAVDSSGNAYVCGNVSSTDYPTTPGTYQSTSPSQGGPVLTELNPSGSGLVFSTYTLASGVWAMTLGPSGGVYMCEGLGLSLYSSGGTTRVFAKPIDPGSTNGGQSMSMYAVASDANGDAYVTGKTSKTNYALTTGAYQTSLAGGLDAFVTKVSSSGSVVYATLVGGSQNDSANAIDVNLAGQAYVTGLTGSSNYPVTAGAYRTTPASGGDAFLTRLNADGASLRYSTYLGGSGSIGSCIRVHAGGSCVIGGVTYDVNFPTSGAFQATKSSGTYFDGILLKFNRDNTLAWASFCGGNSTDGVDFIGMAPNGTIAAEIGTLSTDFPTVSPYQSSTNGGGELAFLSVPDNLPTSIAAVAITTSALPDWSVGASYSQQLAGTGGLEAYSWAVTAGSIPPGMSLSSAGLLSNAPTQAGTFTFTVRLTDSCDLVAQRQLSVTVNPAPSITTAALPDWTVDTAGFSLSLQATGGTGARSFSVDSGLLPTGMSLSTNGDLTGIPSAVGDSAFTIRVTDAVGGTGTRSLSMHVNVRPSIDPATLPACTVSRPYAFTFAASGGTGSLAWSLVTGSLPTVSAIDSVTGIISGSAAGDGTHGFTLRVTDAVGATSDQAFTATINPYPRVLTTSLPRAAVGRPYLAHLAGDGGTPPLAWTVASGQAPSGIGLVAATGAIQGTALSAGIASVGYRYSDSCGADAVRGFSIEAAGNIDLTKKKWSETVSYGPVNAPRSLRFLEVTAGSVLGVTLAGGSNEGVPPQILLTDAAGQTIDLAPWTKVSKKSVTVKGFVVPATGRYFLAVTPAAGFEGKAKLGVTIAPKAAWTGGATIGPAAPSEFRFSAPPGSLVSISAKAGKGSTALPKILSFADADAVDLLPGGKTSEKGGSVTFSSKSALSGGDYTIIFSTRDANVGAVTWSVKLKTPKTYTFAMPDVAAGE